jgi:hypothetical protein
VRGSGHGDGQLGILSKAQPGNQVEVQLAQMAGAVRIAKWNAVSAGTRFTRRSQSLIVGSSSRSSMSATLATIFNFVTWDSFGQAMAGREK